VPLLVCDIRTCLSSCSFPRDENGLKYDPAGSTFSHASGPRIDSIDWVRFRHPGNGFVFLALPAYDPVTVSATPGQYGIHLLTALVACQIVTYNKPGYFTVTRERTGRSITGSTGSADRHSTT
jgi:hypothetical protein